MGSSCAVPDEKVGMPPGVYAHFTPPAVVQGCPTPGEKTSGRCETPTPLLSRAWASGRGAAAWVSGVRGPRLMLSTREAHLSAAV